MNHVLPLQSSYDILYMCTCTIVTYLAVNVIVSLRVHYSLLRKAMVMINACSDVLSFWRMKYLENDVATIDVERYNKKFDCSENASSV